MPPEILATVVFSILNKSQSPVKFTVMLFTPIIAAALVITLMFPESIKPEDAVSGWKRDVWLSGDPAEFTKEQSIHPHADTLSIYEELSHVSTLSPRDRVRSHTWTRAVEVEMAQMRLINNAPGLRPRVARASRRWVTIQQVNVHEIVPILHI